MPASQGDIRRSLRRTEELERLAAAGDEWAKHRLKRNAAKRRFKEHIRSAAEAGDHDAQQRLKTWQQQDKARKEKAATKASKTLQRQKARPIQLESHARVLKQFKEAGCEVSGEVGPVMPQGGLPPYSTKPRDAKRTQSSRRVSAKSSPVEGSRESVDDDEDDDEEWQEKKVRLPSKTRCSTEEIDSLGSCTLIKGEDATNEAEDEDDNSNIIVQQRSGLAGQPDRSVEAEFTVEELELELRRKELEQERIDLKLKILRMKKAKSAWSG